MTPPPLVSIIVPLYNHANHIEFALESFAAEGYPRLEVVLLDDGSSDDSFAVAQRWLEAHPKAFENAILEKQENQGITKTLNTLVRLSNGQYITMVASDDALLPGGIAARVSALENHPEWLSVFGDALVMDTHNQIRAQSALQHINRANLEALDLDSHRALELILRWSVPGPVLLSRRAAFDPEHGVGLYNEQLFFEDRDFYLRLLAKNALGFVAQPVAQYRMHQHNTIANKNAIKRIYSTILQSEQPHLGKFHGREQQALRLIVWHSTENVARTHDPRWWRVGLAVLNLLLLEAARALWRRHLNLEVRQVLMHKR